MKPNAELIPEDKKKEKDLFKKTAREYPVIAKILPGETSLIDFLLVGLYQYNANLDAIELLKKSLIEFLSGQPEYLAIFVAAAFWINFGIDEPLKKQKIFQGRKYLSIFQRKYSSTFFGDALGFYRDKHGIYLTSDPSVYVHELVHAVGHVLYLNNGVYREDSELIDDWDAMAEVMLSEEHKIYMSSYDSDLIKKAKIFNYRSYPRNKWVSELAARMIEYKFLYPNSDWPTSNEVLNKFLDQAVAKFINDAKDWCRDFIEECGLSLLVPLNEINFFGKSLTTNMDSSSIEIIEEAKAKQALVIDVVILRALQEDRDFDSICDELLNKGVSAYSILLSAVRIKNLDLLKYIHGKFNLNTNDLFCVKALHQAARYGATDILKYLLYEVNISPFLLDQYNRGISFWKKYFTDEVLKILVEYENQKSIFSAIRSGKINLVEKLLNSETVNQFNEDYETPLIFAIDLGCVEIAIKILSTPGVDVNFITSTNTNALFSVIDNTTLSFEDRVRLFETLMEKDIATDVLDLEGMSIVHKVVKATHLNENEKLILLQKLKDSNVPMTIADQYGFLPLHTATTRPNIVKVLDFLIRETPQLINYPTNNNSTLLHLAVSGEIIEYVNYILNLIGDNNSNPFLVDINVKDDEGCTPLHLAVKSCNDGIIKALLMRPDLDLDIKNDKNNNAFDSLPPEKVKELLQFRNYFLSNKDYLSEESSPSLRK